MMGRVSLVLVSALLVSVYAGPIQLSANRDTCSTTCTGSRKFNFLTGKTYEYQYESDMKTMVQGASEDHASIHLSSTVKLEILSKCEITMRLDDVTLTEYDPVDGAMKAVSSEFKAGLERFPVRLSYQDGGIEDVCLTGVEPTWVLNAKRGIISLIQNNMNDFETNRTVSETDVSGVCDTEYTVRESGWYTTSVGKSKNLLGCTERHGYNTAVQGVPYTAESDIQSLPLLKSDHNCVHQIFQQSGHLKSVACTEQYMFRPFSKSDSGAVTTNTQTLTYISMTTGTKSAAPIMSRVSLKFDHANDVEEKGRSRKDITRKLKEICEKTKSGVRPETPKLFTDLVYMMKSSEFDTLSDMYKMLNGDKICPDNLYRTRKYFLDALPMVGTSASVQMITELITSHTITGMEADMWLTTLAFIKNPTKDMLREVKPLINAPDHTEKALLSVGTMIHSYCYHHGNCETDDMVKAIVSAFVNKMSKGCKVNENNMKTTLSALRGIGNAGYATNAIPNLALCMKLKSNPVEIRLSAIEAFRRMPCDSDRRTLINILQDADEDSEIRIATYRVLMECPSDKVLAVVRNTLANEQINQVGSYIWTHLTNLMETSDRHKQDIRALLEDETFKKEFDLDKRKFSRNYEGSVFIEKLNTGAKVEGDLIWSSKSFIPRSAMLNLTFDLFGHSVNLFEVGGRAEGLEYLLESLLGPNGYFGNPEEESSTSDMIPKNIRGDKMKKIDKRFTAKMADLRGSMYMRVFGNELRYMNFKGMDALLAGPDINILNVLLKLSENNDYTYSHSDMFLDSSFIVPTGSGFPLNLTVNGTVSVDLRLKGKMDLRHPSAVDIDGLIQPSAAVDISSMMSIDAFVTKSGIKMVSTLHTSTAVQGTLRIDDKGSITTEFAMPEPRMEIIDVKSSFFTVHRDMEREQKMITANRRTQSLCSPQQLVTVTGLELCAEVAYPNASFKDDAPYFPMTGPVSAGIYLYKRDTHIKYKMEAKSIHNSDSNIMHIAFNTPGSRINRHIEVDISLNKRDLTLAATMTSPWKQANMQGTVVSNKKMSGISGKLNIDGTAPYSFDAQLARTVSGKNYVFTPSLKVQAKQMQASFKGMLSFKNWKQVDITYDMDGITADPLSAKLTIHNKPALMGVQGSVDFAKNKQYSFDSNLVLMPYKKKTMYKPLVSVRTPAKEVLAFGGAVTHIYGKGLDINLILDKIVGKKIELKGKINKVVKKRRSVYNTRMDFRSSPADFSIKAKFDNRNFRTVATDIDFTYVIRRVARNNIKLVSKIINLSSTSLTKAKANVNFAVKRNPELNLKILSEIDHNRKHTEIDSDIWYGNDFKNNDKHIEMRFEMNRQLKKLMEVSADIQTRVKVPELGLSLMMKGAHSHDERNLNSNFTVKIGRGQPLETSLQIHDNTNKLMKVNAEYKLSYPGRTIAIDHSLEQKTDDRIISTLKTQTKKGQQSIIKTTITPTETKVGINSDIMLYGWSPVNIQGQFGSEPTDFIASLSYEKDSRKYAGSLSSATENGKSSWLTIDFSHPDRHSIVTIKGQKINDLYSGYVDLQWNTTQKAKLSAWFETPTSEKVNGSISLKYPARTVILNAHLTQGSKYSSHLDFQWEPASKITADTILGINDDFIIGSAKLSTPFSTLPQLNLEAKHRYDSEQYKTDASMSWADGEMVSLDSDIKKPVSFKTMVASMSLRSSKSSINGVKKLVLFVNHKLSSSLASSARVGWNRQFVQANIVLVNTTTGKKMGVDGSVHLKTSYQYMKKGKLTFAHDNNGHTFSTNINFNRNKKAYAMKSRMIHQPSEDRYDNSGSVTFMSPRGNVDTTWNHRHTLVNVATSLTTSWGRNKNQLTAKLNSNFDDSFSTTFDLQTPFAVARDTKFQASYTRMNGLLDSKIDLVVDRNSLGSAEMGYKIGKDDFNSGLTITIPDLNVDTMFEAQLSSPGPKVLSASFKAIITPEMTMSIEGTQKAFMPGSLAHTIVLWKSTLPGYEQVRYTYEVIADDHLATITTLEYSTDKQIKLKTKISYDVKDKQVSAILTTPFESLPIMQGGLSFQGNLDSFKSNAFLEIQPAFDKISTEMSWNTETGLVTTLRIDLPISKYPYFQAGVASKLMQNSSDLTVKIEYMSNEILQLEANHNFDDTALTAYAKASSPFGTVTLQHSGIPHDFNCKLSVADSSRKKISLDIGFRNAATVEGSLTISTPNRRDITALFTHKGDALNFNTHAEVQHNRKNSFVSDLKLIADDTVMFSASGSVRSQLISETDEHDVTFKFEGIPTKFTAHGELSTTGLGKSLADVTLDLTGAKEGSIVIKSPLIKNIKASFNHFQRDDFMESKSDFIHGGKKIIDIQASLNRRNAVVGELSLKTPLFKDIALTTRFDGDLNSFVIRSEGSHGLNKADVELTSVVDYSTLQQKVSLSATGIRDISAEISYNGDPSLFKSFAELNIGQGRHRLDASFSGNGTKVGSFSIESPLTDTVSASFRHQAHPNNFRSHAELTIASDKSEVNVVFRNPAITDTSVSMNVISRFIKDVSMSYSHEGTYDSLNTHAQLSVEGMNDFDIKLSAKNTPYTVSLTVATPFENYTNFDTSFAVKEFNAAKKSFHSEYTFNEKKSEIDASYSQADKYTGQLSVKSHLFPDSSINFEHEGKLNNFKCHADYNIGSKKSEFDLLYSALSRYEGLMTITSHLMADFAVGFEHAGNLRNFKSHGEYSIGFDKTEADISINIANDIDINIRHKCPIYGISTASYTHTGGLNNFRCHTEITRSDDKWEGDLTFTSNNKIQGQLIITPPPTSILVPTTWTFEYSGVPTDFRSHNELILAQQKSTSDLSWTISKRLASASLKLTSPYDYTQDISVNIKHEGEPKNFNCHADITYGSDNIDSNFGLQLTNTSVASTFSLTSSIYEDITANFNLNGTPSDFSTFTNYKNGNDENTGKFSFKSSDIGIIESALDIKSPYMDSITMNFRHSGELTDFSTSADLRNGRKENTASFSFKKSNSEIVSSLDIKSPYMDDINMNFHHSGELAKFTTRYDTTIAGQRNTASVDLNLRDSIRGKVELSEPLFSMESSIHDGVASATMTKDFDQYSATFKYSLKDNFSVEGRITSPIEGYRVISSSYVHSGPLRNFQCVGKFSIERQESTMNIRLNTMNLSNMDGSLDIASPYVSPFDIKMSHSNSQKHYLSKAEWNVADKKMYGFIISSAYSERKMKKQGQIEAYIHGIKHSILEYTIDTTGLNISSEVVCNSGNIKTDVTFMLEPKLSGTFSFQSPSMSLPQVEASIDFEKSTSNFVGRSSLMLDGEKSFHIVVSLNTEDKTAATFTLDLPLVDYSELSGEFTLIPGYNAFKMDAKLTSDSRKLLDMNLDFDTNNKEFINFMLESNEPHQLSAKFYFSNSDQLIKTNWELIHASKGLASGQVVFKVKSELLFIDGSATMNMQNLENSMSIHIDTVRESYKTNAILKIDEDIWSIVANYDAKRDIDASFKIAVPNMDEIRGTFTHNQRSLRSKTNAELRFNATYTIEFDMDLRWRNGINGAISLSTPINGFETTTVKMEHEGSIPNMKSSAEITIAGKVISGSVAVSQTDYTKAELKLATPFENFENLDFSMYHSGGLSNFKTGGRLAYVTGEDIELDVEHSLIGKTLQSKIRFMSAFTNEVILSANYSGSPTDVSSSYELSMGSDNKYTSKTSMKTGFRFLTFTNVMSATMSGENFEQTFELKHDGSLEKFRTEVSLKAQTYIYRLDTSFQLEPVLEGSLEMMTPFENFKDVKTSFTHTASSGGILSTGEIQYAPMKKISGKIDLMQHGWRRMSTNIELKTPFDKMEYNKFSYKHSGDSDSFQCDMDALILSTKVTGSLAASSSPISMNLDIKTPFIGFETIGFNGNLQGGKDQYSGRMQAKWNPQKQIVVDASLSTSGPIDGSLSMFTPCPYFREASVVFSEKYLAKGYLENLKVMHNGKNLLDVEFDHSIWHEHKHALLTIRAPKSLKFEIDGDFTIMRVDFDLTANWNTKDINSHLSLEAGYDLRSDITGNFKLAQSKLPGKVMSFTGLINGKHSKADLAWGMRQAEKIGYEITIGDYDGTVKLVLPTRSLVFAGSHRGRMSEGSFLWDADVDETKKVGFKSRFVASSGIVKADVTIIMPSLGKNVQVGSEIAMNQGRVIFDGKTVLSYSGDSRKNLVFTSRLEDISIAASRNYSFSFGVSHPSSTVDVKVNSHAGKSSIGYSAGIGLEYMTVQKQTRKFQISGGINKLKKSISFELQSPVKSVSISGSAQTDDKFRLSLLSIYDQRQPLSTIFTFDTTKRSIDFVTNYDLDNPRSEFHINAKYVNCSAVSAEVFHIANWERVTDVLLTTRLNNSHLIHSRLHWRPEMIEDLEAYTERKGEDYNRRLHAAAARLEPAMAEEIVQKFHLIWRAVEDEIGEENMATFEAAIVPVLDMGLQTTIAVTKPMLQHMNGILTKARYNYDISVETYKELQRLQPVQQLENSLKTEDVDTEYIDYVTKTVSDNFDRVSEMIKLPAKHVPVYISNTVAGSFDALPDIAVLRLIRTVGEWQIIEPLESYIREAERTAEQKLRSIEKIVMGHMKSPFTVYDPAHGEIQMELYSIIPLQSLDMWPVIDVMAYTQKLEQMRDNLDRRIPAMGMPDVTGEWIPPFTGVASVTLGHKITTFDGYVYDLKSDCTYILTRDYNNGNFSLILSNDGTTTLTVLTSARPISINIQGEVLVGGTPATMPVTEGYTTVIQDTNGHVNITGGDHFSIDYDLTVDHMAIQISGWYHGKTGGLLGIFDNEPSNDLMSSYNKVVGNSARFARTWDVGINNCR